MGKSISWLKSSLLICLIVFVASACTETSKAMRGQNKRARELEKKKEQRRKETLAQYEETRKRQLKAQGKETRKRMRKLRRKADIHHGYKREFFLKRWFKRKKPRRNGGGPGA